MSLNVFVDKSYRHFLIFVIPHRHWGGIHGLGTASSGVDSDKRFELYIPTSILGSPARRARDVVSHAYACGHLSGRFPPIDNTVGLHVVRSLQANPP